MTPLMCTTDIQTSLFHVDYGIPLHARKSTDYRTSTGKNHGFMPEIPQDFDCRAKAKFQRELLDKDIALRDQYQSTYTKEYEEKYTDKDVPRNDQAMNSQRVDFTRTVGEGIFKTPPRPSAPKLSEMKDSYPIHYCTPPRDYNFNFTCEMPDTYRGVQPDIKPGEIGYYKYLDIYMSETKSKFVSYKPEQMEKAREDFPTFYNTSGAHKGFKGELPGNLHGYKNLYDKSVFKVEYPIRLLWNAPKKVPHFGMISEYQSNYPKPTHSDFYPYVQENGIRYPEARSSSSPWQDLCPPAMYCSENCHIGTGWPIRAVVDVNSSQTNKIVHSEPCVNTFE